MARVAVVTDSTTCLPQEVVAWYGIEVVPISFVFEGRVYRDGRDISSDDFYGLLKSAKTIPLTSAASPGECLEIFRQLSLRAEAILCITLAARLSSMFNSFRAAVEAARVTLPHTEIQVMDSGTAAMAEGFVVLGRRPGGGPGEKSP